MIAMGVQGSTRKESDIFDRGRGEGPLRKGKKEKSYRGDNKHRVKIKGGKRKQKGSGSRAERQ